MKCYQHLKQFAHSNYKDSMLPKNETQKSPLMRTITNISRSGVNRMLFTVCFVLLTALSAEAQTIFFGADASTGAECHCLNNATTLTDGQFRDTITVNSDPGQTWTVAASSVNVFSNASLAPPVAPISAVGQTLAEIEPGVYQIVIKHVDALGFELNVSNGADDLSIANSCYYPNVTMSVPDTICLTGLPVDLQADNNGLTGVGTFFIDGNIATTFSAQLLGVGEYTVSYRFDAGDATPNDPTDPGCSTTISKTVIVPEQPNTAVISYVNVTLGDDCQAVITPRMMLSGDYPCLDDFIVNVYDQFGANIGNTVTGVHADQQLNVQVMSEVGTFIGNGSINITDESAPSITCPSASHRVHISNEVQLLTGSIPSNTYTFFPNNFSCYNPVVAPMSATHRYTLQTINVTATDYYTIELNVDTPNGGAFGIYQGEFDPFQGPCQGNVGVGEPLPLGEGYYSTEDDVVRLHVMLTPDMEYTLLTTTYEGNATGNYEYAFYSQGNGQVVGLNSTTAEILLPLYCNIVPDLVDNPASVDLLGAPIVVDACMLNPTLTFEDEYVANGHCSEAIINRTFTVVDQSGNSAECTQSISFPTIELSEVNLPPKTIHISCDQTYVSDDEGNPSPVETGYPFVVAADGTYNVDPVYCNILANYEDLPEVQVCSGTSTFIRRWVVFDNCNAGELIEYDQVIIIGDRTGPVIECIAPDTDFNGLPDTLVYASSGGGCVAFFEAPIPQIEDDCSGWTVITELVSEQYNPITNPFGTVIGYDTVEVVLATIPHGGNRLLSNVPVGVHHLRYTAMDDCWNTSVSQCPIRVEDHGAPTAVCDDLIHVSLGGNGLGVLTAEDVDEGSSDVCTDVTLSVRRTIDFNTADCTAAPAVVTDWGPSVNLYCCEAGSTINVELRVVDENGIENICASVVSIDDTTAPICVAPQPVFTNCSVIPDDTDFDDIEMLQSLYGMAQVIDACHSATVTELTPQVEMGSCGLGTILRTFQVEDIAGNTSTCQQIINMTVHTDYEIKFPKDVEGDCEEPALDEIVLNRNGCDDFSVNVTEERLDVTFGACYRVMRTYEVINWCEYDGFSPAVEVNRNVACLPQGGTQDVWVIRRSDGTAYYDIDNDETNNMPAAGLRSTVCDGNTNPEGYWAPAQSNGKWQYTQILTVTDSNAPVVTIDAPATFCSNNAACEGSASINFSITDGCSSVAPDLSVAVDVNSNGIFTETGLNLSGVYPNYQVSGIFPLGNHRLRISAVDQCSNPVVEFVNFNIADCAAPGLICNTGIVTVLDLQPDGVDADGDGEFDVAAAAVNVNLFVNSTGTDCSGPLRFTIHKIADVDNGADIPFPNHPALVVTCDDVGFVPVRIYAWDSAYNPTALQPDGTTGGPNYTTCDALLNVQDPNNFCTSSTSMGIVAGLIITEGGQPVAGVEVSPRDDMMEDMMMTENDGLYSFDLATQEEYTITPYSLDDYTNGVTTIDIVLMSKHILGTSLLDSPYKMIAADVNRSNSITTLDMVQLRKAILGVTEGFSNNTSWRFIDAAYTFPDPTDPWTEAFPETLEVSSLNANINSADFIAVKIGDINGNVVANVNDYVVDNSNNNVYYLRTDDYSFDAGETVELVLSAADELDEVQGFQFTLQFDPNVLALEDIEWAQLQSEHANIAMADEGIITISWNAEDKNEDFEQGELSFMSIRFNALNQAKVSEVLGITSKITKAEAYGFNDEARGIALNFMPKQVASDEFFLEQNRPNPFGDQTIIGFQIPESGTVTLTIYDTNGKTVQQYQQHYAAGYNQILVDAKDVKARGLLYYKLETDQYAATKKMVILE